MIDLKKANKAQLLAELDLYREGNVEGVATVENLKVNKDIIAEIERLQEAEGIPMLVTEAFMADDSSVLLNYLLKKGAGEELTVGEIIFLEQSELDEVAVLEKEAAEEAKKGLEDEEEAKGKKDTKPAQGSSASMPAGVDDRLYLGKTVTSVSNIIMHGKTYKDVTVVTGETFRISPEEFERDTKFRSELI